MSSEARVLKTVFKLGGSEAEAHSSEKETRIVGLLGWQTTLSAGLPTLLTCNSASQGCIEQYLLPDGLLTRSGSPWKADQEAGHVVQAALEKVEKREPGGTRVRARALCLGQQFPNVPLVLVPPSQSDYAHFSKVPPFCHSKACLSQRPIA